MGKKSGPTAPVAPDPMATAQAQAGVNKDAAIAQANLNRVDQVTPQGNLSYSQIGTNSDGTPRYQQTQTLSPDEQTKYDQNNKVAMALNGLAINNVGRVADTQSKDFTFAGLTPQVTNIGTNLPKLPGIDDFSADAKRVSDSVYGQAASRLDPQFTQGEGDIRSKLAAQGISENSDAYRRELDNFNRSKTDAYNQANFSAVQAGGDEQSRLFGLASGARSQLFNEQGANATLANQGRQQDISEASYLRNLPLNEIASLLGTGAPVENPTFNPVSQVGVAAPDYQGAVQSNYQTKVQQQQAAQAARSQALGQIFGTAGSAAMAFSDRRLKRNICRVGSLANGLATYTFRYIWGGAQQFGVMAQEVFKVLPNAVHCTPNGYLVVDYGKVY